MLVSVILLFLQILTMAAWGESNLKKTPEGKLLLAKLSSAGLFFLKWRAFADYKKELVFLRKCFGCLSIALVFASTIFPEGAKPLLSFYTVFFMGLWISIRMTMDVKAQLKEMFAMAVLYSCVPFLFLLLDWFHFLPYSSLHVIASPLRFFGAIQLSDFELALILALLFGFAGGVMAVFSVIMFSIIPLLLLFVMVVISRVSKALLSWELNRARNCVAAYVLLVGPTLILLHAMQVI